MFVPNILSTVLKEIMLRRIIHRVVPMSCCHDTESALHIIPTVVCRTHLSMVLACGDAVTVLWRPCKFGTLLDRSDFVPWVSRFSVGYASSFCCHFLRIYRTILAQKTKHARAGNGINDGPFRHAHTSCAPAFLLTYLAG